MAGDSQSKRRGPCQGPTVRGALACSALLAASWALAGCVTTGSKTLADYPDVDVEDPDPEKDLGPHFCNPTGKSGDELKRCHEHNEAIYKDFDEEAKQREPWFNFTPDSWVDSREVAPQFVWKVTDEAAALPRLERAPLVELTAAELQHLTGKGPAPADRKAYLVRGLIYYRETGAFSVFEKDHAILVRHDSLGEATPKETRSALVVLLPYKPAKVYVDCQVSE